MFPGFVFFLLFGLEVFIGGMITEPGLFPIRLVWLGMALLINENYRSAVFWGTLGGVSKDLLSHGLIGLNGIPYLLSLAILQWISKKNYWISDGYFLPIIFLTYGLQEIFSVFLQNWLFPDWTSENFLTLLISGTLIHGLLATLILGSKWIWTPRSSLRKHN